MTFPEEFKARMKDMLGDRYAEFLSSCENEVFRGMRVNTLKISKEEITALLGGIKASRFCSDAFYIDDTVTGNHPLHHAGAFYIQEPSASSAVECMEIEEGDRVLDLCAAPGGKSTQIAAHLNGNGVLVSNEYVASRVTPLVSNIERMGITNAVVLNARPDELADTFCGFFDKILVDAPCSGEGMFRKEPKALENWSIENSKSCKTRQLCILESAAEMLKKDGILVYSTCTFSPYENEQVIEEFLKKHPEFCLEKMPFEFGTPGIEKEAPNTENISYTRHIFPFDGGEGHYVARMKKTDGEINEIAENKGKTTKETELLYRFLSENFDLDLCRESFVSVGEKVYITAYNISAPHTIRNGVLAGEVKGERFEPSHALYSAFGGHSKNKLDLSICSEDLSKYLRGEEIPCDASLKGYTAVLVNGIPLSFGKASGARLKNHYPKGLRRLK